MAGVGLVDLDSRLRQGGWSTRASLPIFVCSANSDRGGVQFRTAGWGQFVYSGQLLPEASTVIAFIISDQTEAYIGVTALLLAVTLMLLAGALAIMAWRRFRQATTMYNDAARMYRDATEQNQRAYADQVWSGHPPPVGRRGH